MMEGITGSGGLEHLLDLGRQLNDMIRRSGPEDEAIAVILEAGLDGRIGDAQQVLINDELLVLWREELVLLQRIALYTMRLVEGLNLGLVRKQVSVYPGDRSYDGRNIAMIGQDII